MTKSHVSMAQHQCIVCGEIYDTGEILLDRRLKNSLEERTLTGKGFCEEHQKLKDDGYIALCEAIEGSSIRTGRVIHIKNSAWEKVFNSELPPNGIVLCAKEVFDCLHKEHHEKEAE
jgi:hypothetical protein